MKLILSLNHPNFKLWFGDLFTAGLGFRRTAKLDGQSD
jgi:hypothetical protein